MSAPLLVVVDDGPDHLRDVERELRNRYEPDYRVCCLLSPSQALGTLKDLAAAGEEVALVLAGETLDGESGTALLAEVPRTFPHAQRGLLIAWGQLSDAQTGDAIFEAISRGRMDHFLLRPSRPPDEQFHQAISSFLLAWAEARQQTPHTVNVIAVGDIRHGSVKRVASAVGEGSIAIQFVHRLLAADSARSDA